MRAVLACLAIAVAVFIHNVERQRHHALTYITNEDPVMFEAEVSAMQAQYKGDAPVGGVVFMGDSLIRLWHTLETDMAPLRVLNHGFGGSKARDNVYYIDRLVTPFDPQVLVVSFGTNDIHGINKNSKSGEEVADSVIEFFETVHAQHPGLPIIYISVTPVPTRWKVWEEADKVNVLIEAYAASHPHVSFLDLRPEFIENGTLKPDLYDPDDLHLSAKGYAVWAEHVKPALGRVLANL